MPFYLYIYIRNPTFATKVCKVCHDSSLQVAFSLNSFIYLGSIKGSPVFLPTHTFGLTNCQASHRHPFPSPSLTGEDARSKIDLFQNVASCNIMIDTTCMFVSYDSYDLYCGFHILFYFFEMFFFNISICHCP